MSAPARALFGIGWILHYPSGKTCGFTTSPDKGRQGGSGRRNASPTAQKYVLDVGDGFPIPIVRCGDFRTVREAGPYGAVGIIHLRDDVGIVPYLAPPMGARRVKQRCRWHLCSQSGEQAVLATRAVGWHGGAVTERAISIFIFLILFLIYHNILRT